MGKSLFSCKVLHARYMSEVDMFFLTVALNGSERMVPHKQPSYNTNIFDLSQDQLHL